MKRKLNKMGNCEKCLKKTDEVYEVSDEYICLSCLDDYNNKFELLKDLQFEK